MAVVALVVGRRRILRGVVLRIVLAIVLRAVLLWIVTLLHFLSVTSERAPEEAPLGWRGVLVRVTLLLVLCGMDEGYVCPCDPPPSVHGVAKEDRKDDRETGDSDGNTCSGAQSFPANIIVETDGKSSANARLRRLWGRK